MKTSITQSASPSMPAALPRRRLIEGGLCFAALTLAAQSAQTKGSPSNHGPAITIHVSGHRATLINVCSVEPENQQALIDIFKEGTEAWISTVPGYISTSLHKSLDGRRVVIYSQWQHAQNIAAMRDRAEMGPYLKRISALSTLDSTICEVTYTRHA